MIHGILKFLVFVLLPFGIISAAFGVWFDNWLAKKYPQTDQSKLNKIGTIAMLGLTTVLLIGFFVIMHLVT